MCGIFGLIGNIDRALALKCLDTLSHRGPDAEGMWCGSGITLGHRRLSILDLSDAGRQPMVTIEGRYIITFNGEIYNFLEIRRDLEQRGYRFFSDTDTEVLVAAYDAWGSDCLNRFNGMWAFGIWDNRDRRLFLARDRFGKKPLFYSETKAGFAFASEMKAIMPLMERVEPSRRFRWLFNNVHNYEATEHCLIEGIKRFPAGHYAMIDERKDLRLTRYWNTLDNLPEIPPTYPDQVERFRELFVDACRLRMRSDVPVGTALSGGLDSSAVACTMAHVASAKGEGRTSRDWQHAFIARFPETPLDETTYAELVVKHINLKAVYHDVDPIAGINRILDYIHLSEELYPVCPIPMMQIYSAVKAGGVSVTLDGHGADEMYAGYPRLMYEAAISSGIPLNELVETYRALMPPNSDQFIEPKNPLFLHIFLVSRKLAKRLLRRNLKTADADHPNFKQMDELNRLFYGLTHRTILPTLLRNYDRYAMANSVEVRMPFMDHRLVTYAMALPAKSKIGGGYTKRIIRDALRCFMPAEIVDRKLKIGFSSPMVDWMRGPLRVWFLDVVYSDRFNKSDLIDPARVRRRVLSVVNGSNTQFGEAQQAWYELLPYLWEESMLNHNFQCKYQA